MFILRVLAQVKVIEGLGTTMDVVLVNGCLREGQQIVVCGLGAPIVTTIRSLLTPHPMKASHQPLKHHSSGRAARADQPQSGSRPYCDSCRSSVLYRRMCLPPCLDSTP